MIDQERIEKIKMEIVNALAQEQSPERIRQFFNEMLTESEMSNIVMRWELMKRLLDGQSQRNIAEGLGLSLCKITRGSKILKDHDSVVRSYLVSSLSEIKSQSSGELPSGDCDSNSD